jgi:hypothetical protein
MREKNNMANPVKPAPGTGGNYDEEGNLIASEQAADVPEASALPEDKQPTTDEIAEAKAVNDELLRQARETNAKLRIELKEAKAVKAGPSSDDDFDIDKDISDAAVEGGAKAAPDYPVYPEGATKTFVLNHELINGTPDGLKRYKKGVEYTLDAQTVDDLRRRDAEYGEYERLIHVRQKFIQPIGTISGNG